MRLQALEKHVGGDLEKDVRNEEDDQSSVVFGSCEAKICRQAVDIGIGNVHTWEVSQCCLIFGLSFHYRSKNARRYMMHRKGSTCQSILVTSLLSVVPGGHWA